MRSTRLIRLALAAALLAFAAAPVRLVAQSDAPAAAVDSTAAVPAVAAPAPSSAASTGLPLQAGPPRTLRAYWHVFIAYTIVWLLVFGYVLSLGRRFGRLERELNAATGNS